MCIWTTQDSNFYPYSWAPPLENKKFQSICPWCFKAALDLERVESLKPMAKMRLEHICSKFSVLPISSSSFQLSNWELVIHYLTLLYLTLMSYRPWHSSHIMDPSPAASCSQPYMTLSREFMCSWVWKNLAFCDALLPGNSTLSQIHSVIYTMTLWDT